MLCLLTNGQAQTRKALYINVMFSNDIKLMSFLLAALTVLRSSLFLFKIKWICFNLEIVTENKLFVNFKRGSLKKIK